MPIKKIRPYNSGNEQTNGENPNLTERKGLLLQVMARLRFPAWLVAVLLARGLSAFYWPAMRCDFTNDDDDIYVTEKCSCPKRADLGKYKMGFWANPWAANGIP